MAIDSNRKPILLTVDDDPGVSRAVARDLRRQYGEAYRVVRAESGPQALETLRELKLRGDPVAVLLADHRMPEMSGLEFLEEAMDLFPSCPASAAHCLCRHRCRHRGDQCRRPRPLLAEAVGSTRGEVVSRRRQPHRAVARHGRIAVTETRVVGHRWSARSFEVRDFLARNSVPYRWHSSEEPEGQRLLAAAGVELTNIPLVVTSQGKYLVAPSLGELAASVGLSTAPTTDFYDVVIVGGGPAGLGAAVYAASEGLRTVLVERQATGGQAGQSARIENYLGFPDGVTGTQLTDRARRQAQKFGAEVLTTRDVIGLDVRASSRAVQFADGGEVVAHAVLLATGISYRKLGMPGAETLTGRGVFYGSAATEAPACGGEDVYIVGAGNSAGQAAVFLSRHARRVTLLARADTLEHTMSYYLIRQIDDIPNVDVRLTTEVIAVHGDDHLEQLTLCDHGAGTQETVRAGYLFVFIGAEPRTEWLEGVIARDSRGFVLTGPDLLRDGKRPRGWNLDRDPHYLEASAPGVFAAGDVRANSIKRVASAVGEGAMAIQLLHTYLEHQ